MKKQGDLGKMLSTGRQKVGDEKGGNCGKGIAQMKERKTSQQEMENGGHNESTSRMSSMKRKDHCQEQLLELYHVFSPTVH